MTMSTGSQRCRSRPSATFEHAYGIKLFIKGESLKRMAQAMSPAGIQPGFEGG